MALSVASFTTAENFSNGSVTINKPSGVVSGGLLVCLWFTDAMGAPSVTPASGFVSPPGASLTAGFPSVPGYEGTTAFYIKETGASEPSSYTFSNPSGLGTAAILAWIPGAGAADVAATQNTTTGTTGYFPSVTTTAANDLILLGGYAAYGGTPSGSQWANAAPSGTTMAAAINDSTNNVYLGIASAIKAAPGATGGYSVPVYDNTTASFFGVTLAISPTITGTSAATEGADVSAGAGQLGVFGSASTIEGADTSSGAGSINAIASGAITEGADSASGAGTVVGAAITGAAAITEGADTSAASGFTGVYGSSSTIEGSDSASGAGVVSVVASGGIIEGADQASANGSVFTSVTGSASITEQADFSSSSGLVAQPITGSATIREQPDTMVASQSAITWRIMPGAILVPSVATILSPLTLSQENFQIGLPEGSPLANIAGATGIISITESDSRNLFTLDSLGQSLLAGSNYPLAYDGTQPVYLTEVNQAAFNSPFNSVIKP